MKQPCCHGLDRRKLLAVFVAATVCCGGLVGCRKAHPEPIEAKKVLVRGGAVILPDDAPQRRFIKIEAVSELEPGELVSSTGKVGFDEDRTSRVSSPVNGR